MLRDGVSPSEAAVATTLAELARGTQGRVFVTTFASNVARLRAAAEAGFAAGRQVLALGRAIERVVAVARECGYFDGVPALLGPDRLDRLPRDKILALATGSQGESRAALARLALDERVGSGLTAGDRVIFSSRTIPGNEKAVGRIVNALAKQGIEVVTDRTHLVHVSGHPRRAELARLYDWLKPKIAVPAHGEPLHLSEHAAFARSQGVGEVVRAYNGDVVRLAPGEARVIARIDHGKLMKDGAILLPPTDDCVAQRRKLAFAGVVSIALRLDRKGRDGGRPRRADRRPAEEHPRRGRDRRGGRRGDLRDIREPAARQAARPRLRLRRGRARGAQHGRRAVGQEADGARADRRGVGNRVPSHRLRGEG